MERMGQAQKEYSLHEEGLYKTKDIASRTFYRPDKGTAIFENSLPLITLALRFSARTRDHANQYRLLQNQPLLGCIGVFNVLRFCIAVLIVNYRIRPWNVLGRKAVARTTAPRRSGRIMFHSLSSFSSIAIIVIYDEYPVEH